MEYIEQDCTIEHEGRKFSAGGAYLSADCIVAYLGASHQLTDWHGKVIGTYRITASWRTPRSFMSSTMHQVRATVDGITYTGRSAGIGMIYRGRKTRT